MMVHFSVALFSFYVFVVVRSCVGSINCNGYATVRVIKDDLHMRVVNYLYMEIIKTSFYICCHSFLLCH